MSQKQRAVNVPSILLENHENEALFQAIGRACTVSIEFGCSSRKSQLAFFPSIEGNVNLGVYDFGYKGRPDMFLINGTLFFF